MLVSNGKEIKRARSNNIATYDETSGKTFDWSGGFDDREKDLKAHIKYQEPGALALNPIMSWIEQNCLLADLYFFPKKNTKKQNNL